MKDLKRNFVTYAESAVIPMVIVIIAYAINGLYWNSSNSILASDAFTQGATFLASFHDVLHGKLSLLYNWNAGLGLNYMALYNYYLGGVVTPLVGLFPKSQIPNAFYGLTVIKFGLAGLSGLIYLKRSFKFPNYQQLMLSTFYAILAFGIVNAEQMMWLDVLYILPMLVLGTDLFLKQKSFKLIFIAWLLMVVTNFYMAFIVGLFIGLYFLVQLFVLKVQRRGWMLAKFAGMIIWSTLTGGAVLFPLVATLIRNKTELSTINGIFTDRSNLWDLPIKSMVGAYDGTKFGTSPYIYVGLIVLICAVSYFFNRQITKREKIGFGILLLTVVSGFYLQIVNLTWQGWHFPAMFLYRYSFLWSFLLIILAAKELEAANAELESKVGVILGAIMMVATLGSFGHYQFISIWNLVITLIFLVTYILLIHTELKTPLLQIVLMGVCLLELLGNTGLMIYGVGREWHYPSSSLFTNKSEAMQEFASSKNHAALQRMESLDPISRDDGIRFNYGSVNFFSSVTNRPFEQKMNDFGFKSNGSNLNMTYGNNTLVMDSVLGMQNNVASSALHKYGFEQSTREDGLYNYENQNALKNAILINYDPTKIKFSTTDNLGNQNELLNLLSRTKQSNDLFDGAPMTLSHVAGSKLQVKQNIWNLTGSETTPQMLTMQVKVPKNKQAYLSLFRIQGKVTQISVYNDNRLIENYNPDLVGQYVDLGYFSKAKTINVKVVLNGASEISFVKPTVVTLDTKKFQKSVDQAKQHEVALQYEKRTVKGTVKNVQKNENMLLTIPYDPGWQAQVNGKVVKVQSLDNMFCVVPLKKGVNHVSLKYRPVGFVLGVWCGIVGMLLFFGSVLVKKFYMKN